MTASATPFQPYADVHKTTNGPGDARPTALQVVADLHAAETLRGRTILITGASSGIGVETARALYETGAQLYLAARDIPKVQGVIEDIVAKASIKDAPRPEALELHLDSLSKIREAAAEYVKRSGGKLNILINNAGVMACPLSRTSDNFELQFGTNHLGHFLLFQLLKPSLLSTAASSHTTSRVINLSSAGHRMGGINFADPNFQNNPDAYDKWRAYGQSKTANILMATGISRRYGAQDLHGWSVHPGGIATELGRHLNEDDYVKLNFASFAPKMKSPAQGAATTVWAALAPRFEDGKETGGRYLEDVGETAPMSEEKHTGDPGYAPWAFDEEAEGKLWKLSCEAVGVKDD